MSVTSNDYPIHHSTPLRCSRNLRQASKDTEKPQLLNLSFNSHICTLSDTHPPESVHLEDGVWRGVVGTVGGGKGRTSLGFVRTDVTLTVTH